MEEDGEEILVQCECGNELSMANYQTHLCSANEDSTDLNEENVTFRLIEAVQARQPLWDHTLPLKVRGKDNREKLWREVYEELNASIPLNSLEKKWKNLRDTFLKHMKTYKPSGSGTEDKKKWKHLEHMMFLAKINSQRKTTTNISPQSLPLASPSASSSTASDMETPCSSRKKKKTDDTDEMILNILKDPLPPVPNVPQVSPALMTINSILEKLPVRVRMKAEIDMLNQAYSLYDEFGDN